MRKQARKLEEQRARKQPAPPPKPSKRDESNYCKRSCRMQLVTEAEFFDGRGDVEGLFFWKDIVREINGKSERCRGIFARYPGGDAAHLPVRPIPDAIKNVNGGHSWAWDGNLLAPTLTPSVHIFGNWHGWVRAGEMRSC